jgi:pimeloyl-ACP methyl ester carboxylesterase
MDQEIRYCATRDGVRLAWASHGQGPPIVKAANWLTHLEYDWKSPVWRYWLEGLGRSNTLIRYDGRCCGLSDWEVEAYSLEHSVADLESVVDAAGVERFTLFGISGGAAIAVAYAARHPERIERLVLYGGYARGRNHRGQRQVTEALIAAIRAGWDDPNPAFRRMFTMRFIPDGTPEQLSWFDELQRRTSSPENAARMWQSWSEVDVRDLAPTVSAETLVAHARGDVAVPFEEGRLLASLIPNARLLPLESANHLLLPDDPAWPMFLAAMHEFTGDRPAPPAPMPELSSRERELMELVVAGESNEEIAERLFISVRTVERHLSNVYAKLGVSGKAGRAAAAARFSQAN